MWKHDIFYDKEKYLFFSPNGAFLGAYMCPSIFIIIITNHVWTNINRGKRSVRSNGHVNSLLIID